MRVTSSTGNTIVNDVKGYPQQADFTFFGGMYRWAQLIIVPPAHFAFDPYVRVQDENVTVCAPVENAAGENMHAAILNAEGECVGEAVFSAGDGGGTLRVSRPRLWNGRKDPYLYTAKLSLDSGDTVEIPFGFRSFTGGSGKGFSAEWRTVSAAWRIPPSGQV